MTKNYVKGFYLFLTIGFFFSIKAFSQCPTISNSSQAFCDSEEATIADLQAQDQGNGVVWYSSATSTTPLSSTTTLVNGTTYYVDDSTGTCGTRESVAVTIYGAPTAQQFQGFCITSDTQPFPTVADLFAVGENIAWYTSNTSTTALDPTTTLQNGTLYYASQSPSAVSCETTRLQVLVSLYEVYEPNGDPQQSFCYDSSNPPTIGDLVASGQNNWYTSQNSVTPLSESTVLQDGFTYYATTVIPPCESDDRLAITVTLYPENNAGEDGSLSLCEADLTSTGTIDLFTLLNGTPDTGGTWIGSTTITNGTIDALDLSAENSPFTYTYTVNSSTDCPEGSATVTITVDETPDAGTDGSVTFCISDAGDDLFNYLGGTPATGGTWSPALASGTGVFTPGVDAAGVYTYSVTNTSGCQSEDATVTVTVENLNNAGTDGATEYCEDELATVGTIDLFSLLGGTPDAGGSWTGAITITNGTIEGTDLSLANSPFVFTYTVTSASCPEDTATVTITVNETPDAGTDGSVTFCISDAGDDLFNYLGGTPATGGTWSPALASGTGVFTPGVDAAGVYTYSVTNTSGCQSEDATVTVTVENLNDAGDDGAIEYCEDELATVGTIDLFSLLGGTPDAGGSWTGAITITNGTVEGTDLSLANSPFVFTYTVTSASCPEDTATVTITVNETPDAGTDGSVTFCISDAGDDLFNYLGGTPATGGTWSPALASGTGVFTPGVDAAGVYTYSITNAGGCQSEDATVTVAIDQQPNAGNFIGIQEVCSTDGTFNLATLLDGSQDAGGVWTDNNGNTVTNPLDVSVYTSGTYTFSYVVSNACGVLAEDVQLSIIEFSTIDSSSITTDSPICLNSASSVSISGLADGSYDITYSVSGANTQSSTATTITVVGGTASFGIDASVFVNSGISTVTIEGLSSNTTACQTTFTDVTATIEVLADPTVDSTELSTTEVCLGNDGAVTISGSSLIDGNYQFDYTITGSNGTSSYTSDVVAISNGSGVIAIDATSIPSEEIYTIELTTITNTDYGCTNTIAATTTLTVTTAPDVVVEDTVLEAFDVCLGSANEVYITNATIDDGDYTITYTLSGATVYTSASISINFLGGEAVLSIDEGILTTAGDVTISLEMLLSTTNSCPVDFNGLATITFNVFDTPTPEIIPNGNQFCSYENPTFADLNTNILTSENVIWYNAPQGGTAFASTDELENGVTYYGVFEMYNDCPNAERLAVQIILNTCITIPDGFSPNADGVNDTFEIENLRESAPNFTLEIFNRYGGVVYKGDTNTPDWDGTSTNGKGIILGSDGVPTGVYFYILTLNDGQTEPIKGRLYLNR